MPVSGEVPNTGHYIPFFAGAKDRQAVVMQQREEGDNAIEILIPGDVRRRYAVMKLVNFSGGGSVASITVAAFMGRTEAAVVYAASPFL